MTVQLNPWTRCLLPNAYDRSLWTWVWSSHSGQVTHSALNIQVALSSRNLSFKLEFYILDKRMRLNWFWLILFRDPGRTQHLTDRNTANAAAIFFQFSIRFFFNLNQNLTCRKLNLEKFTDCKRIGACIIINKFS